jgi:hypothetical protein
LGAAADWHCRRLIVRVTNVRQFRLPTAAAATCAAARVANNPNTADPLPDIAACDAPWLLSALARRPIAG